MTPELMSGVVVTVALLVLSLLVPSQWRRAQSAMPLWLMLALTLLVGLLLYRLLVTLLPLYRVAALTLPFPAW